MFKTVSVPSPWSNEQLIAEVVSQSETPEGAIYVQVFLDGYYWFSPAQYTVVDPGTPLPEVARVETVNGRLSITLAVNGATQRDIRAAAMAIFAANGIDANLTYRAAVSDEWAFYSAPVAA